MGFSLERIYNDKLLGEKIRYQWGSRFVHLLWVTTYRMVRNHLSTLEENPDFKDVIEKHLKKDSHCEAI
nr:BPK_HP1_G0043580.mRNA.1.CDS.1 [Saccharomyces cerevisiae]